MIGEGRIERRESKGEESKKEREKQKRARRHRKNEVSRLKCPCLENFCGFDETADVVDDIVDDDGDLSTDVPDDVDGRLFFGHEHGKRLQKSRLHQRRPGQRLRTRMGSGSRPGDQAVEISEGRG